MKEQAITAILCIDFTRRHVTAIYYVGEMKQLNFFREEKNLPTDTDEFKTVIVRNNAAEKILVSLRALTANK